MIPVTPAQLLLRLLLYYLVLLGGIAVVVSVFPATIEYLPVGGDEDFSLTSEFNDFIQSGAAGQASIGFPLRAGAILVTYLIGAVLAVLPVTWVYMATQQSTGFKSNLVRALLILPICATSTVLLIKDSLALAFGLAALVAAIRFRVRLSDPLDGVYILASIAVGLAAGMGYVGVGLVTTFFFTIVATLLWQLDYGRNPVEDGELARKRDKPSSKDISEML
jgi:hypothetical protein